MIAFAVILTIFSILLLLGFGVVALIIWIATKIAEVLFD